MPHTTAPQASPWMTLIASLTAGPRTTPRTPPNPFDDGLPRKYCGACGEHKLLAQYQLCKHKGHQHFCRACVNRKMREHRAAQRALVSGMAA